MTFFFSLLQLIHSGFPSLYDFSTEAVAQRYSAKKMLRAVTLLKKRLWLRCFPLNFAKCLRTPFFT